MANLTAAAVSCLNIAILLAWLAFGTPSGVAATILSIIAVLWLELHSGVHAYSLLIIPFIASSFLGGAYSRLQSRRAASYALKLDKIDEETNILADGIIRKNESISALEEKLKRYSTLKEAVESLSALLALDDINRLVIEKTLKTLGKAGRALLFLVDTERQELALSASDCEERVMAKKGDVFDQWVLRHRKSLIVEDVTRDFRFPAEGARTAEGVFRSLVSAPLVNEDKVIGILRMDNAEPFAYTQDDLRLLDIISDLAAVSIHNAMLYSRTQELSIRDGLTGLFVRRYFLERLGEEMKRSARNKGTLSLLLLDIDHFKDYNDKYGHAAGDLVLKYLARTLKSIMGEGDIVARYGGEELVVLLCGKAKKAAFTEAERIRKAVRDKPLSFRRLAANITLSIGVSSYPDDASAEEELIRAADERLYKAKAKGRDRVCSD